MVAEATADLPARRRASWNFSSIVEDVAGRPIGELQEPGRPIHPYLRGKVDSLGVARARADDEALPYDPVGLLRPPLSGATGRAYHGPGLEHHRETLDRHRSVGRLEPDGRAVMAAPRHPERLYLHYLLLHIDRLSASELRYLRTCVDEEIAQRVRPAPKATAAANEPPSPPPPPTE